MKKQNQPVLSIEKNVVESALSWMGGIALMAAIGYCVHIYPDLPDRIATKFNTDGQPKSYSTRQVIFALPIIGILTWALLQYLSNFPHWYNYPFKVTPDNAQAQYEAGVSMMLRLNFVMTGLFALITWDTIRIARCVCPSNMNFLGVATVVATSIVLGMYFYKASRLQQ